MSSPLDSETCVFCAIARGKDQSVDVVCEDAGWVAFFPLDPATPGHTLVIPRDHVRDLWRAESKVVSELVIGAIRVGNAIQAALHPDGMNLITSAGSAAEQTVFHLHLHVVPRWRNDGFDQIWPTDHKYENADLGDVAHRIREACGRT
jgi:histidine triad (HIT) family protein